jgi:hypothetical protein
MPNENAKILIIDDKKSGQEGGGWEKLAREHEVPCKLIVRETKEEMLSSLEKMFQDDPNLVFDGTVLDVIYLWQPRGGIELWEELENRGLADRCGKLLVTTKHRSDEVVDFVEKRGALLSTSLPLDHKRPVFKRLLRRCGLIQ